MRDLTRCPEDAVGGGHRGTRRVVFLGEGSVEMRDVVIVGMRGRQTPEHASIGGLTGKVRRGVGLVWGGGKRHQ
jgi:hypothetical protein